MDGPFIVCNRSVPRWTILLEAKWPNFGREVADWFCGLLSYDHDIPNYPDFLFGDCYVGASFGPLPVARAFSARGTIGEPDNR